MKIILDTNVIISAFISQGLANRLFEKCIEKHQIYISNWILDELLNKLENKFNIHKELLHKVKKYIDTYFNKIVINNKELPDVCRDKDDNNILLLAENINADLIITGDKDLLVLKKYKNIKIIDPRKYFETYEKR